MDVDERLFYGDRFDSDLKHDSRRVTENGIESWQAVREQTGIDAPESITRNKLAVKPITRVGSKRENGAFT